MSRPARIAAAIIAAFVVLTIVGITAITAAVDGNWLAVIAVAVCVCVTSAVAFVAGAVWHRRASDVPQSDRDRWASDRRLKG